MRGIDHQFADTADLRVVKLGGMPDRMAEVAGTEENHVNPRHFADFIQFGQRFGIFDLHNHHAVFIGETDIFPEIESAVEPVCVAAVHGTQPQRLKPRHTDDFLCLLQAHQMRHHDSGSIGFQRADIITVAPLCDSYNAISVMCFCCKNLRLHCMLIRRDMLLADPDGVKTGDRGDFHSTRTGQVEFIGDCFPSCTHFRQDPAFSR